MEGQNDKKEIKFNLAVLGKNKTVKHPTYGCLKHGKTPTFRQTRAHSAPLEPPKITKARPNTIKHYTSFGKKNSTVRVLVKTVKDFKTIDAEKRKLDKHSLADICTYLTARNLYNPGSDAPEDVLREIYRNAFLAGNVSNSNPETLIDNYMSEKLTENIQM